MSKHTLNERTLRKYLRRDDRAARRANPKAALPPARDRRRTQDALAEGDEAMQDIRDEVQRTP